MLNKKVLKYIDYNFGDRVSKNFIYGGIYKKNILLIKITNMQHNYDVMYTYKYYKIRLDFKTIPTINELNYLINSAYKNAISICNLLITKIEINEFLHVDNIYYTPNVIHYILRIKRIPIG